MKKKILILGSSSFAGASMVNFILKKENFKILSTYRKKKINQYLPFTYNKNFKKIKQFKIDLLKDTKPLLKIFKNFKPDYIIDFASICMVNESWLKPDLYFKTNVLSKAKILNYLSKARYLKKYIYISTPEVFGSSKKYMNENEEKFNPSTPYATSKLSAEKLLKNFSQFHELPLIICRFSNFYGPGQPLHRLIPKVLACIDNKRKFAIQGDGKSMRNFIYSDDFCKGIFKVIKKGKKGNTYHFSGNKFYSVLQIIKIICDLKSYSFKKLITKAKGRIGLDSVYKLGTTFTKSSLGWKPDYSLKKGLNEIVNYHNKNFKKYPFKKLKFIDEGLK